jgi:fructose-1,6-bisphosphatase/inositol monophosphatase family enzyme
VTKARFGEAWSAGLLRVTEAEADAWLDVAHRACDEADEIAMASFRRDLQVSAKPDRTFVTEADTAIERAIRGRIAAAHPDHGIVGEEYGTEAGTAATRWYVDPIDGTNNFVAGIPFFCVSIALLVDGRPVVGVVRDPLREETLAATSDGPATIGGRHADGGRPVRVSEKERLSDFVISLALSGRAIAGRLRAVRKAVRIPRTMGSAALALAYVGNRRFDAFVQEGGLSAWDVAAAGLIAERAGARVTDMSGGEWFDLGRSPNSVGILAAPAAHHAALLQLVGKQESAAR